MADFRRWILALAMLVLVLGSVAPASAQGTFACNANAAVPPTLRQEGITELAGDIILTCSGGTATPTGTLIPQASVSVYLSLPLSSRVLSGNVTEALLLVDEPSSAQQLVCPSPNNGLVCQATGDNGASFATNGDYNVFQGIAIGPNAVTFLGIPVDPPTSPTSPARIYRITNIRVNASAAGASVGLPTPINTLVSISASTSIAVSNPSPVIGIVQKGLTFTPSPLNPTLLQCQSYELTEVGSLTFTENFAGAFKIRTTPDQSTPGAIYGTESGLWGGENLPTGPADFGTRLMATITNIPAGASISVDNWALSPASIDCSDEGGTCFYATLVGTDPTVADPGLDVNGGLPAAVGGITDVTDGIDSSGTLTVVWEVVGANAQAIDQFTFGVYVSFTGAPGNPGTPTPNVTAQVVGSFAPLSSAGPLITGGWVDQIPTFVTTSVSSPPANLFNVSLCQTILLFPYITDYPGFDTGIAISNTSADPLPVGAAPQTGSCSVNFYGGAYDSTGFTNNAANLGSSGVYSSTLANFDGTGLVGPGQTWTFGVSAIDAMLGQAGYLGTTGYAIAVCDFQYAHGYSFVSDYGLRNFAAAYLALVIPDAPRSPEPFLCSAGAFGCINQTGEQLVH